MKYVYYPYETDMEILAEFFDFERHEVMGDIAIHIEINSISDF